MPPHSPVVTTPTASAPPRAATELDALRRGDPEALGTVYREHGGQLHRLLHGMLGDRAEAEDLLHDLFVGLPEALRRYEDRGLFGAWLRRVAARLALQRLRSRKRRREVDIDGVAPPTQRAAADGVADQMAVQAALAALPEHQRVVVVLRELEGWSHRDIADFLGIRPGTVMTRHCRALKQLRLLLEDDR